MQSLQHSMAHRGVGATRTNTRWHPYTPPRPSGVLASGASTPSYAPLLSSASQHIHSQDHSYLITPASSVYTTSPASTSFSQSPHTSSAGPSQTAPRVQKPLPVPKVQSAKANYVASLVDQAVKSLNDIWRPECIPLVFATSTQISVAKVPPPPPSQRQEKRRQSVHLPSPCSPSTLHSPLPVDQSRASIFLGEHFGNATIVAEKDLVPIKTFIYEVLRRSRTTCSVLQSALCYIEAIRTKVPELAEKERQGLGVKGEPELDERIVKEDSGASASSNLNDFLSSASTSAQTELMSTDSSDMSNVPTVLQADASQPSCDMLQQLNSALKRRKVPAKPLSPLPPLPSPLLCPRRTFLAALILASKFLQDRCYSNRAWAKLSGLPPREVGRCERALGDALEWRLWVGKGAPISDETSRGVMRTKSESTISFASSSSPRTQSHMPSPPLSDSGASPEFGRVLPSLQTWNRPLRRAATLPDESAFANRSQRYRPSGSLPFSFAGPSLAVIAVHQSAGLNAQQSLSSTFTSQTMLSSESTPRLSYSPLSLVEPNLDTPSTFCNTMWSPAHSTTSTDSSDSSSSGSSSGSSVATPPEMPSATLAPNSVYFNSQYVSSVRSSMLRSEYGKVGNIEEALEQLQTVGLASAADHIPWYSRELSSTGTFDNETLSMLDSLNGEWHNQV